MSRFGIVVFALVMLIVPTFTSAQELPDGDPRNPAFRVNFNSIVQTNPTIENFHSMQPGTVYNLPDGSQDFLRTGDTQGIWGREFQKWYGLPYLSFLEGVKPTSEVVIPPILVPPPMQTTTANTGFNWAFWLILVFAVLMLIALVNNIIRRRLADPVTDATSTPVVEDTSIVPASFHGQGLNQTLAATMSDEAVQRLASGRSFVRTDRGPDFVPGGIRDSETLGLAASRAATIDYARQYPTRPVPHYTTVWVKNGEIGNLVSGTFFPTFGDGSRGPDKIATRQSPIRAWRTVAIVEGEEVISYVEVICGNGMGRSLGIGDDEVVFEPDIEPATFGVPGKMQPPLVTVGTRNDPMSIEFAQQGRLVSTPWNGSEPSFGDDGTMFIPGEDGVRRFSPEGEMEFTPWRN